MSAPRNTIDDATPEEWDEATKKAWYGRSAKIEGDSAVSAGTRAAPITEAHELLFDRIAHGAITKAEALQLIADSEARALSVVCGRHVALIAERDAARAEVARLDAEKPWLKEANATNADLCAVIDRLKELTSNQSSAIEWAKEELAGAIARAERAEREVEALKQSVESGQRVLREDAERNAARAERAEAELAAERARFAHLAKITRIESGNCDRSTASYYVIHIPTGRDYYKGGSDLPLAEAIDAAMKEGAR